MRQVLRVTRIGEKERFDIRAEANEVISAKQSEKSALRSSGEAAARASGLRLCRQTFRLVNLCERARRRQARGSPALTQAESLHHFRATSGWQRSAPIRAQPRPAIPVAQPYQKAGQDHQPEYQ